MLALIPTKNLLAVTLSISALALGGRAVAKPPAPLVTVEQIQSAPAEQRTRIVGTVAATLADDKHDADRIKREGTGWTDSERAAFEVALDDVASRAKVVRRAMKAAEGSSDETWSQTRSTLAEAFASYTAAERHLHVIVTATTDRTAKVAAGPESRSRDGTMTVEPKVRM